ncbi:NUDIX domain-containing protein [Marivirga sericea]|uniref:NUDIX domain-containing protein n=1 Tax=Marivirga sericea TaxID=1028 RepID=A0A1X7KJD3_9BACT|nr:NUDIX hydrolase [Marivirga sericea]SMG40734.1 NUDIX domain-containing protein [Marivirga sericea]
MELLKNYIPVSETEQRYKEKMLELYETKGEQAFNRSNLEAHFTASAWIVDPYSKEILLLHHKKLNKWLQPGGHADGETNLEAVARKEVKEETALENLHLIRDEIFDIDIHLIPENKGIPQHEHFDVRFAYFCNDIEKTQINFESNDFHWINLDKVESLTNEPSILRMKAKSKLLLNGI